MAGDVFICYAHQDKLTADAACAILERMEVRCWIAPRDMVLGEDYGVAIMDAIEQARVLVLILSAHANDSPHVKREVEGAVRKKKIIIPVRIEDVSPSRALEYFIFTAHWLDAFPPPQQAYFERLAGAIKILLGQRVEGGDVLTLRPFAPATPPPMPPPVPPPPTAGAVDDRTVEFNYWTDVKNSKDPSDFETFLEKFPHGTYESMARRRVETLLPASSLDLVERFLHEHPASERAGLAHTRLVEFEWQAAEKSRDPVKLRGFITRYGASPQCARAKLALAKLEWSRLYASADADEIERTFADLADSPEASLARQRATLLRSEDAAWKSATAADSTASYQHYVRDFPAGRHAADARARLKAMSHDGPREHTYLTIAIAGILTGIVATVLSKMNLFAIDLGSTYLLSAHRVLYVGAFILLVAKVAGDKSLGKLIGTAAALYVMETIFGATATSGIVHIVIVGVEMLLEWLFVAMLFLSTKELTLPFFLKDKLMVAIAIGAGLVQGFASLILLGGGIDTTVGGFAVDMIDFSTTGLCLVYGIRRFRQTSGAIGALVTPH